MLMRRLKRLNKRTISLFLALTMCLGLLTVPAAAEGECRFGQDEACVCTEEACLAECPVCHPAPEGAEDAEAEDVGEVAAGTGSDTVSDDTVIPSDGQEENACTCGAEEGAAHAADCPLYTEPQPEPQPEEPVDVTGAGEEDDTALPPEGQEEVPGEERGIVSQSEAQEPEPPAEPVEPPQEITGGALLAMAIDGVITLEQDYVLTSTIRLDGRILTIQGAEGKNVAITRSENFSAYSDNYQSWHSGPMIEVATGSTLTLRNIKLDDADRHSGQYYIQTTLGVPNTECVQAGIIEAYDGGNHVILDRGTVLANYGGMSAVRITGGCTLTMNAGSAIVGGGKNSVKDVAVTVVDKDGNETAIKTFGAAGAVWMQGGTFTMNAGAEIKDMSGRAVYVDSGSATINGTISGITPNNNMWWAGETGIHVRNGGQVTLGGTIDNMVGGKNTDKAVQLNNDTSSFRMVSGAVIKHTADRAIDASGGFVYIDDGALITDCTNGLYVRDSAHGELNGTIQNGKGGHPVQLNSPGMDNPTTLAIGPTGKIINNYADYGAIYCQSGVIELYGRIEGNYVKQHGGGIATPGHGAAAITMYEGASVSNNYAGENGGGIQIKANTTFTMKGGTISGNINSNGNGGGVCVRNNAEFIMEGGTISGNSTKGYGGGISYDPGSYSVELLGGIISNNKMQVTIEASSATLTASASGGVDNDLAIVGSGAGSKSSSLYIGPGAKVGSKVYMTVEQKTVSVGGGSRLGNSATTPALKDASKAKGWGDPKATLWIQSDNAVYTTVQGTYKSLFDENLPVYVLTSEGKSFRADLENGVASFNTPGSVNGLSVALVQPGKDYGELTLVAQPTLLKDNDEAKITYTLTYKPSDNVLNSIEEIADTAELDMAGQSVTKNELKSGFTRTWTENVIFEAGRSIEKSATLTITIGEAKKEVPSNLAVTRMEDRPGFTVSFDSRGGSEVAPQTVKNGDQAAKPADPTREGYTFGGWFTAADGGAAYDFTTPVTESFTLYAHWTQNDFTVTLDANGGTVTPASLSVEPNTAAGTLPTPTRDGYTFLGWNTAADGSGTAFTAETVVTESLTVYAQWRQNGSVGISASPASLTGGGTTTLTVTTPDPANTTVTCNVSGVTLTRNTDGTYRVSLPNSTAAYTFTATLNSPDYTVASASCTVSVTRRTTGGGGTGGGGGGGGTGGGGGGRGTTTIIEDPVPLAGGLQLNKVDHFAYIKGYADGTVKPNNPITRAQAATIFYRLLTDTSRELYFQETNDFSDVSDAHWANKAISTLSNAGVINGFQDGTFRPDAYITRAQFTVMTARFEDVIPGLENVFTDVAEDHWARDQIAYAAHQGWITGGGTFRPQENITRVEVMDLLNNVLDRRVDAQGLLENAVSWTDVKADDPYYYVVMEATISHDWERRSEDQIVENWTKLTEDPVWDE